MASAFSHALSAIAIGKLGTAKKLPAKFWILGMVCAVIPDLDVVSFNFGIPYDHLFGHRGFSHSLFFAFAFALILMPVFFREYTLFSKVWIGIFIYLVLCTASHGLLDAMTSGGKGVAFFAPFENSRYFLPWRPIKVSPISISRFFSEWGWKVIKSELLYVGLPCAIIIFVTWGVRYFKIK